MKSVGRSFADLEYESKKRRTRREKFLEGTTKNKEDQEQL